MNSNEIIKGLQIVCKCRLVKYKTIKEAIKSGAITLELVRKKTGANTGCGKMCTEKILQMFKDYS